MNAVHIPIDTALPGSDTLRILAQQVRSPDTRYVLTIAGQPVATVVGFSGLLGLMADDNEAPLILAEQVG